MYKAVKTDVLLMIIVALASGICLLIFFAKMLRWKKSGFWGFTVTTVVTTIANLILTYLILKGFKQIEAEIEDLRPVLRMALTALTVIAVWAILQIRKDGVSCWKQME